MLALIRKISLLAALLVITAIPAAAHAADYGLTPEQPSVAAGRTIFFTGTGFVRGERVVTWATAPDQTVFGGNYVIAEGSDGKIEVGFDVPRNAIGGRWSLTAYGLESRTPVVAGFDVQGRAPDTTPQAAVDPAIGAPGTEFKFMALGYSSREKVSYWLTGPDGQIHAAFPEGDSANRDGRVDLTWAAPADALRGVWVITIQGLKSDVARGIPFEIR
jgi:hypothetical protein